MSNNGMMFLTDIEYSIDIGFEFEKYKEYMPVEKKQIQQSISQYEDI